MYSFLQYKRRFTYCTEGPAGATLLLILDVSHVSFVPPVDSGGQIASFGQPEESGAAARQRGVEGAQTAPGNQAFVLFVFLTVRDETHGIGGRYKPDTVTVHLSSAYHVGKVGHAEAVGLDALVSHDVVHQHHFPIVEPDLLAVSFLRRGAVGPPCPSEKGLVTKRGRENEA